MIGTPVAAAIPNPANVNAEYKALVLSQIERALNEGTHMQRQAIGGLARIATLPHACSAHRMDRACEMIREAWPVGDGST
jgi:hypothetical protein